MALTKRFLEETGATAIRGQLEAVISSNQWQNIESECLFVKAMLGFVQELCFDRDNRMGFDERSKLHLFDSFL